MTTERFDIVILGLSITSSWGNGHATTYRGLVRELSRLGHAILFLERDVPWYADNRDLAEPPYGKTRLYDTLDDLKDGFAGAVRQADLVIVGSYVPDGIDVGRWVQQTATGLTAFYDIDTPVTMGLLEQGDCPYLTRDLIPGYDLYLSFSGGSTLVRLEQEFGSPRARPLYCSVDPDGYFPEEVDRAYDLGYLGTYSADRQPPLENLMLDAARRWPEGRYIVAGPQYPDDVDWPVNVERIAHIPPDRHRSFYNAQRFTLNITRADMIRAGYSPSVRLFEAAACGVPIISDYWTGIEHFLKPGKELFISRNTGDTLHYLKQTPEEERRAIGSRARRRVLSSHTAADRAQELIQYLYETHSSARLSA